MSSLQKIEIETEQGPLCPRCEGTGIIVYNIKTEMQQAKCSCAKGKRKRLPAAFFDVLFPGKENWDYVELQKWLNKRIEDIEGKPMIYEQGTPLKVKTFELSF